VLISVFVKSGQNHSRLRYHKKSVGILTCVFVGETEQLTE